jgi:hypothetical protein
MLNPPSPEFTHTARTSCFREEQYCAPPARLAASGMSVDLSLSPTMLVLPQLLFCPWYDRNTMELVVGFLSATPGHHFSRGRK